MYDAQFNQTNACASVNLATNSSDLGCRGSHFLFIFKIKHLQTFLWGKFVVLALVEMNNQMIVVVLRINCKLYLCGDLSGRV